MTSSKMLSSFVAVSFLLIGCGDATPTLDAGSSAAAALAEPCADTDGWDPAWAALEEDVVARVNAYRAQGVVCGRQLMPAAPPLALHPSLRCAARRHSKDMAVRHYFSTTSPEGEGPWNRLARANYDYYTMGEVLAAGRSKPLDTVAMWIARADSCASVLDARFQDIGIGYFRAPPGDPYVHYWVLDLGTQR